MKLKTSIILCSVIAATTMPAVADSAVDLYAGVSVGVGALAFVIGWLAYLL